MSLEHEEGRPGGTASKVATATTTSTMMTQASDTATNLRVPPVYDPGAVRVRASRDEMAFRRAELTKIAREAAPASVRNLFYRAVVAGLVPKDDNGYKKVQRTILELRREGVIPWDWVVDRGRRVIRPYTNYSVAAELQDIVDGYHRTPWQTFDLRIEIWSESDSFAGQLEPVGNEFDVPIYPIKGQTSDTFVKEAAEVYSSRTWRDARIVILFAGDHDPAGLEIESQLHYKATEYSGRDDIEFHRLTITDEQADAFQALGTTPKKTTWRTADGERMEFSGQAIESEALPADRARQMFTDAIVGIAYSQYGYDIFAANKVIETTEREHLRELAAGWSA